MLFFKELFLSIQAYFKTLEFISFHRLWGFFIVPAIINLLIFIGIGILAYQYSGQLITYFSSLFEIDTDSTLNAITQFFLSLLIRTIVVIIYLKMYRYTILILMAPVLAIMAQRINSKTTDEHEPFRFKKMIADATRGIGIALKNILRELALTILILLLALIVPIFSPFAPPLIFIIESYYYGFSMIDYFNELEGLSAKESRDMIWSHKGMALGNGAMFNILLLIPVLGVMTSPLLALTASHLSLSKVSEETLNPN